MKRTFEYIFAIGLLLFAAYLCKVAVDVRDNNLYYEIMSEAHDKYKQIVEERGISEWDIDAEGNRVAWWWAQMTLPVAEADDPLGPGTKYEAVLSGAKALPSIWDDPVTEETRESVRKWFRKHEDAVAALEKVAETPGYRSCLPYEEMPGGAPNVAFLGEPRAVELVRGAQVLAARGRLALLDGDVGTAERCLDRIAGLESILRIHPCDAIFSGFARSFRVRLFLAGVRDWPVERLDAAAREAETVRREAPQRLRDWTATFVLGYKCVLHDRLGRYAAAPVSPGRLADDDSPEENFGDWSSLRRAKEFLALMEFCDEVFRAIDRLPVEAEGKEPTPGAGDVLHELEAVRNGSKGFVAQILDTTAIPGFNRLWAVPRNEACDILAAAAAERERRGEVAASPHFLREIRRNPAAKTLSLADKTAVGTILAESGQPFGDGWDLPEETKRKLEDVLGPPQKNLGFGIARGLWVFPDKDEFEIEYGGIPHAAWNRERGRRERALSSTMESLSEPLGNAIWGPSVPDSFIRCEAGLDSVVPSSVTNAPATPASRAESADGAKEPAP